MRLRFCITYFCQVRLHPTEGHYISQSFRLYLRSNTILAERLPMGISIFWLKLKNNRNVTCIPTHPRSGWVGNAYVNLVTVVIWFKVKVKGQIPSKAP